jgi:hypothetical protein
LNEKLSSAAHRQRLKLGLFLAAAVAMILVAGYFLLTPSVYFRIFHDEASYRRFMATCVRPGCTMAEIQQSLGDGVVVTEKGRLRLVAVFEEAAKRSPEFYPDGAKPHDQFVGYKFGLNTFYLQFRDGVLVNFNPREYDKPFEITYLSPEPASIR